MIQYLIEEKKELLNVSAHLTDLGWIESRVKLPAR
jgi:hypothetical protein